MATTRRFWVEVTPRFGAPTGPAVQPVPAAVSSSTAGSPSGRVPRLTELAVAVGLEGPELDAELASVREQRSTLAAYEAGLIERKATLGAAHPLPFLPGTRTDIRADPGADAGGGDPALQAADDFLPDEVAVLVNMSVPSARYLVEHDLVLVRQLPDVWHALADGRIDDTRARVIVAALRWQAVSYGGSVPDDTITGLAGRGVGWAAGGCPPTTLKERLDAALIAADPAAADRRKQLRKRAADVTVTGTGDGLAELRATQLDAADARLVRAQVDAYAKVLKADGDTRPIGAIRLAVFASLVMRPWEQRDPVTTHINITADLTDLRDPDVDGAHTDPAAPRTTASNGSATGPGTAHVTGPDADEPDGPTTGPAGSGRPPAHRARDSGAASDQDSEPPGTTAATGSGTNGAMPAHTDPTNQTSGDPAPPNATPADRKPVDEAPVMATWADATPVDDEAVDEAPPNAESVDPAPPNSEWVDAELADAELAGSTADEASMHQTAAQGRDSATGGAGGRDPAVGGAGHVDGLPVTPTAVRALLQRIDALGLTHPGNGTLAFTLTGQAGRVLAVATPEELLAAARTGNGIGPPPATAGYTPTAAQYRYLRARDRHCRFPGCRQVALACDADHVIPYDHAHPPTGGPTCVTNLTMLCRHHHRLKTHAKGWAFRLDPDGTLHVTTPGGVTRTTRPPAMDEILDLTTQPAPPYDPADDPPHF